MVEIIFESHATTTDNELKIASGHYDVDLSNRGEKQAQELGQRRADEHFDAIFTSDTKRASRTASIAFGTKFPIIQDGRLRECDYGDFEHMPSSKIESERLNRITEPFPSGESYEQRTNMMKTFLDEILEQREDERVMIIGSRATQYGLERWVLGKNLGDIVIEPWDWQPGWTYQLTGF